MQLAALWYDKSCQKSILNWNVCTEDTDENMHISRRSPGYHGDGEAAGLAAMQHREAQRVDSSNAAYR